MTADHRSRDTITPSPRDCAASRVPSSLSNPRLAPSISRWSSPHRVGAGHPGQLIGATAGAGDGTSALVTSEATVGAMIDLVGSADVRGQLTAAPHRAATTSRSPSTRTPWRCAPTDRIAIGRTDENGEPDIPTFRRSVLQRSPVGAAARRPSLSDDLVAEGRSSDGLTPVPELPDGLIYTDVAAGNLHAASSRSDNQVTVLGGSSIVGDFARPYCPGRDLHRHRRG